MSDKYSELLLDDSFVRFLNGNASENETAKWHAWMEQKPEHAEFVKRGRRLVKEGFKSIPTPNAETELKKLIKRINPKQGVIHSHLAEFRKRHNKVVWATMAAAAGVLLLIGFLARDIFFQNDGTENTRATSIVYQTMSTDFGERKTISYSDGSRIVLNARSQIRLPENVTGYNSVEVWLQGEALFNIDRKSDSNARDFIVHTSNGDVSVLGTKFAVSTNDEETRVVLAEGRLRINARDSLQTRELQYEMIPGELALFSSNNDEIQIQRVNPAVYTSWASDSLVLDQTPLADLINRIEFTYGVKVIVNDEGLLRKKLTGRFDNLELEFLLEGLSKTLDVGIERREDMIYIE